MFRQKIIDILKRKGFEESEWRPGVTKLTCEDGTNVYIDRRGRGNYTEKKAPPRPDPVSQSEEY